MSEKPCIIKSPAALASLAANLSPEHHGSVQHIHLALLQPLSDPEFFDQSRDFISRYVPDSYGTRANPTKDEYLDITTLSKAWRKPWSTFPACMNRVTFDLTLPDDIEGMPRFYRPGARSSRLAGSGSTEVCLHFRPQQLILLLSTLATVMRVRSGRSGNEVSFDVVCNEDWHDAGHAMRSICQSLSPEVESLSSEVVSQSSDPAGYIDHE